MKKTVFNSLGMGIFANGLGFEMMHIGDYNSMLSRAQWIVPISKLILSNKTGEWCKLPYPNHPRGCPNYGKSAKCPPDAPRVNEYFDISKPLYLVHSEFDLRSHVENMHRLHPDWSDLQCRCVLYWQSRSRKQMKERVGLAVSILKTDRVTACPEAMGVNVFATALKSGLKIERTRSIDICRHVALIGYGHICPNVGV